MGFGLKRISVFLTGAALCLGLLSGCKETPSQRPGLDVPFTCDAKITMKPAGTQDNKELSCEAGLTRLGSGNWSAEFTSPDTLSGLTLTFTGQEVRVEMMGLSFLLPEGEMPLNSAARSLFTAIDACAVKDTVPCTQKDGLITYQAAKSLDTAGGSSQGMPGFTLCVNAEDSSLVSLEIPDYQLTAEFSSYTPMLNTAPIPGDALPEASTVPVESPAPDGTEAPPAETSAASVSS